MAFGLGKAKDEVRVSDSPIEKHIVKVVFKRMWVGGHLGNGYGDIVTNYFMTFERLEDGYRWQFGVCGNQYGLLIEGDTGELSIQDGNMLGFQRLKLDN